MSKAIKLRNDLYLDTRGIVHKGKILADILYPIGSVYMSTNSTSPETLFGGSWTKIEGRFLWATINTPMTTGGSFSHKHYAGSLVACYDPKNSWNNALFRVKDVDGGWTLSGYMGESRSNWIHIR